MLSYHRHLAGSLRSLRLEAGGTFILRAEGGNADAFAVRLGTKKTLARLRSREWFFTSFVGEDLDLDPINERRRRAGTSDGLLDLPVSHSPAATFSLHSHSASPKGSDPKDPSVMRNGKSIARSEVGRIDLGAVLETQGLHSPALLDRDGICPPISTYPSAT